MASHECRPATGLGFGPILTVGRHSFTYPDLMAEVEKFGIVIPVSDPLRAEHDALVSSMDAWFALSPEERARRSAENQERRRAKRLAVREAAGSTELDMTELVRGLCRHFDWTPEYVQHLAQPYCDCGPARYDSGWEYCDHAWDLGFER